MLFGPVARDQVSAAFFDGTRSGEFRLRRRRSTGEYLDPRTAVALGEEDDLEWVASAGTAKIVSWAVVHVRSPEGGEPTRTVVGIVELDEGPWWWCQLDAVDSDTELAGLAVRADFVPSGPAPEHEVIPVFRPAGVS